MDQGNWDNALERADIETLRLMLLLIRAHYETHGAWLTADELLAKLKRPGA